MAALRAPRLATVADLSALPDEAGAEVVAGAVVYKASPSFAHGDAQSALAGLLPPAIVEV